MVPTFTCNNNHNFVIINYSKHPKWFVVIVISTILSDEKCDYIFQHIPQLTDRREYFQFSVVAKITETAAAASAAQKCYSTAHRVSDIHFTVHCSLFTRLTATSFLYDYCLHSFSFSFNILLVPSSSVAVQMCVCARNAITLSLCGAHNFKVTSSASFCQLFTIYNFFVFVFATFASFFSGMTCSCPFLIKMMIVHSVPFWIESEVRWVCKGKRKQWIGSNARILFGVSGPFTDHNYFRKLFE